MVSHGMHLKRGKRPLGAASVTFIQCSSKPKTPNLQSLRRWSLCQRWRRKSLLQKRSACHLVCWRSLDRRKDAVHRSCLGPDQGDGNSQSADLPFKEGGTSSGIQGLAVFFSFGTSSVSRGITRTFTWSRVISYVISYAFQDHYMASKCLMERLSGI